MTNLENLSAVVRFHRTKSGLSQKQLAIIAGVGKTVVFDVEKGKTSIKIDTLAKILNALNIKLLMESPLMSAWEKFSHAQS